MHTIDLPSYPPSDASGPLLHSNLSGMTLMRRGKDKDIYDLGDMLLIVSTDRLSTPGKSLRQGFKGKGTIINQVSAYWFRKLRKVFPNHLVSADPTCFPASLRSNVETLNGRGMLVWKATPLPVRCVVTGYLAGAAWGEYQERREICGTKLPEGLVESQRLPFPLFSPSVKGPPGGENENIDFDSLQHLLGKSLAEQLREASLRLYFAAWKSTRERGVLIADTTFEFGLHDGKLMLIDECLTPDTSRFWGIDSYRYGGSTPSMDKQFVMSYLETLDSCVKMPHLPEELLLRTREKYHEACKRIVGKRAHAKMAMCCGGR